MVYLVREGELIAAFAMADVIREESYAVVDALHDLGIEVAMLTGDSRDVAEAVADELGIDWDRLNVNGGSIAIGHPFGMTGARIMTTLLNALEDEDKQFGLETMCVGGGQGMAMIVERLK